MTSNTHLANTIDSANDSAAVSPELHLAATTDLAASSRLLSEIGTGKQMLLYLLNYEKTLVDKKGLIGRLKKQRTALDLDIACLLYNAQQQLLESVWFKQLRDLSSAIRHHGDSLTGQSSNQETPYNRHQHQEQISCALSKLPTDTQYIALILTSFEQHAIANVAQGDVRLSDDEGNPLFELDLTSVPANSHAIWVATLSRELDDWRLHLPQQSLEQDDLPSMATHIGTLLANS